MRFEGSTWADPPHRFEAGTPNIAGFIGLGAAVEYLQALGIERIAAREQDLLRYATDALARDPGPAHPRRGAGQGAGDLVPRRWRARPRPRHPDRRRGHRGALRRTTARIR